MNLSRLQSRGRASEIQFFTKQQKEAARNLRAKLSPTELSSLTKNSQTSATSAPTIDALSEISAHRTYDRIVRSGLVEPTAVLRREGVLRSWKNPKDSSPLKIDPLQGESMLDPSLMRGLGQSRYSVAINHMKKMQQQSSLQTSKKVGGMEDGAVIGVGAFGIATAIVGSVGLAGLGYMYMHPQVIDKFRYRSIALRETLDGSIGKRLRKFSDGMKEKGSIVSPETTETARGIARSSIGLRSTEKS